MKIREIYAESIEGGYNWLTILIEFLVFEKEVISFDDDQKALNLYFKPNNQSKMNQLLIEYYEKLNQEKLEA